MDFTDQIEECIEHMVAYKKALGDNLKPITIKKYKGDLKGICNMCNCSPLDGMDTLKDHAGVINTLHTTPYKGDKLYNKESLKGKIGVMSMLMEAYDHQDAFQGYYGVYNDIRGELMTEDKQGTSDKRVKAKEHELTKEDIAGVCDKWKDCDKLGGHLKYLATCCMSKIPSRRTEYGNTKIIKSADEITANDKNYLLMDDEGTLQFVLQEYKTAGKYGRKTIDVPDDLSQDILDSYIKFPRDYLFPKQNKNRQMVDEPMGSNTFTKHIARIFPSKKMGVNSFRKFSKNHGNYGMCAGKLAKEMGHSISTAESSYTSTIKKVSV